MQETMQPELLRRRLSLSPVEACALSVLQVSGCASLVAGSSESLSRNPSGCVLTLCTENQFSSWPPRTSNLYSTSHISKSWVALPSAGFLVSLSLWLSPFWSWNFFSSPLHSFLPSFLSPLFFLFQSLPLPLYLGHYMFLMILHIAHLCTLPYSLILGTEKLENNI